MLIQTSVGQPAYQAGGATPNLRSGKYGDTIVSALHGRYYEQAYNGNMFCAASQSVATTTVGLATTYTGLVIWNPIGSSINMVLTKVSLMQSVIQSTQVEAYGIATGYSATTAPVQTTTVATQTLKVGSGLTSIGKAASSSTTLPVAPVYTAFLGATGTSAVDSTFNFTDLEGSIVLTPGGFACLVTPAQASVAGIWMSFFWEEVPV